MLSRSSRSAVTGALGSPVVVLLPASLVPAVDPPLAVAVLPEVSVAELVLAGPLVVVTSLVCAPLVVGLVADVEPEPPEGSVASAGSGRPHAESSSPASARLRRSWTAIRAS